jgi:hypothetical protein
MSPQSKHPSPAALFFSFLPLPPPPAALPALTRLPCLLAATVAAVLPFLLTVGVPSSVAEVRRLSLNTVTKLVKQASPALLRPHVADLVGHMLEGLSTLEDSRLNYYQLHVDRMDGRAAEQLESARVAAARDSPMWATLDLCLRQVRLHAAKPGCRITRL